MNYKIGLRNKVALCITLPKKAVEGAGMAQGSLVGVESVSKGHIAPSEGIFVYKATSAPKQPIEVKTQETPKV